MTNQNTQFNVGDEVILKGMLRSGLKYGFMTVTWIANDGSVKVVWLNDNGDACEDRFGPEALTKVS